MVEAGWRKKKEEQTATQAGLKDRVGTRMRLRRLARKNCNSGGKGV